VRGDFTIPSGIPDFSELPNRREISISAAHLVRDRNIFDCGRDEALGYTESDKIQVSVDQALCERRFASLTPALLEHVVSCYDEQAVG